MPHLRVARLSLFFISLSTFSFFLKKVFLLFLFLVFLSNLFYCWHHSQTDFRVGAPWRCGVLTTQGGMAGIGFGRLLGREHDSTPQSGVEAPRL